MGKAEAAAALSPASASDADVLGKAATSSDGELVIKPVSVCGLFKFADTQDKVLILLGALGGVASGAALPLFSILLGGLFDDFNTPDPEAVREAGNKYALLFGMIAIGASFAAFLQVACFTMTSERQTLRIRKMYLNAILRQEIAFFDLGSGELSSSIAENTVVIRDAMGDKLGLLFQFGTMFFAGFAVGFYINWQLTLVVVAVTPLLAVGGFMMMRVMADATSGGLGAYAKAGAVAEETFTMIRTVVSFGLEDRQAERYRKDLVVAEENGIKKSRAQGLGMGMTMGTFFLTYALAFWYGAKIVLSDKDEAAAIAPPNPAATSAFCAVGTLTAAQASSIGCFPNDGLDIVLATAADVCNCLACACGCAVTGDCVSGGDIVLVFFSVVLAAFSLGQAAPSVTALSNGRAAAGKIFAILSRTPSIDASSAAGLKPDAVVGALRLENVSFRYPSRPETLLFDNLTLDIPAGKSTALVGGSGSGKSTVTQLVQRFYDPEQGSVTLDGVDIRELNVRWLREHMSLVSQEPILFATSIAQNIAYGCVEGYEPTREEIARAARPANAYEFIMSFPQGFDTFVGEGGSSMSGGQKQRIAIARAMIRDPALLILDEATSALDNESERIVQAALDDLLKAKARTTIVIAHRLTTVRDCDKIIVMGDGKLLEEGTHNELVAKAGGHYNALLAAASKTKGGKARKERRSKQRNSRGTRSSGSSAPLESDTADGETDNEAGDDDAVADDSSDEEQTKTNCFGQKKKQKKKKTEEELEELYTVPISRIFTFSKPEKMIYIPAIFSSVVNGVQLPLFAILFSGISTTYFLPTAALIQDQANTYALYFVAFSVVGAGANLVAFQTFGTIGERMTTRVRLHLFKALLRQDVGFFDDKKNSVGALTSRLATDAALVKASLADRLNLIVMNLATVVAGLVIAFYYGWELTLILIGLLPLLIIAGAVQMAAMGGVAKEDDKALAGAGQVLSESIHGIRTVTAFALRDRVVSLYDSFLEGSNKLARRKGLIVGFGFGISQGMMFVVYAIAFQQGARLIADPDKNYDFARVISVFFAVVMMGTGIGQSAAMTPDVAKASRAISNVFRIVDRKTKIDPMDESGLGAEALSGGDIEFRDVDFAYPTRSEAKVFDKFSLTIKPGQTVALVGQSGSGKSTAIALLERFYDPSAGEITFQGIPLRSANLRWLRGSMLGLVQQEPALFGTTVFENIAYGVCDAKLAETKGLVTEEMVVEAAKKANAHEFISELPDGYQTQISSSTLSGGQKQRIAIARCLIRDPDVLLLDEATAALDNESEAIVQVALDKIMEDPTKTTIVVAHRLSTIKGADVICVVHHGQIVEKGTHEELLAKGGAYAKLYKSQK